AKLYGMTVVAPSGAAMSGHFASDHGPAPPRPYSFAVSRATFDMVLLRAAERAGAVIRERTAVEDLVWDRARGAGVVARSCDGQRVTCHARVVVGADGLHSVVARRLGLVCTSRPRRVAFTAHLAHVDGMQGMGELHVGRRGYVGLGPIGEDVTTVALVVPLAAVRGRTQDFRRGFFAELERYPRLSGRFERRRLVRDVLATGPFAQWARRPAVNGALLVGDAADFFDPFTGQGIYAALRGAELAADCLIPALARGATSTISVTMLEPYVRARRRPIGMTASSVASVSLEPPLLLVCVDRRHDMHPAMQAASRFVLNVLAADQEALSRRFAAEHPDRFDGVGYTENEDGLPLLD